jgi:hypothetical protein
MWQESNTSFQFVGAQLYDELRLTQDDDLRRFSSHSTFWKTCIAHHGPILLLQ